MAGLADLLKGGMDDRGYGAGGDDSPGDEPDYDASGKAAMKSFIGAVRANDPGGAWEALKTAYDLCEKSGGMGEPDGDEGEPKGGGHALLLVPHGK